MAEPHRAPGAGAGSAQARPQGPVHTLSDAPAPHPRDAPAATRPRRRHPYAAVLASRVRSQLQYPVPFAADVLGMVTLGLVELVEVLVVVQLVPGLNRLTLAQTMLVFALTDAAWGLANMVAGHLDQVPELVRTGRIETFFTRPLPLLAQVVTAEVSLRRLGRTAVALAVLVWAAPRSGVTWDPAHLVLLAGSVLCGAVVFAALFAAAGAVQFWLVEGAEFTNAFTYGSHYAAQYAVGVMARPLQAFFCFVVPAGFVGYVPVLALTGTTGPFGLGPGTVWAVPLVAVVSAVAAGLAWQAGVRHYTGAGG